jgi:putative transposase
VPHLDVFVKVCHTVNMPQPRRTLKRWDDPRHVRYITCSCYRRLPLFGNGRIKDAFVDQFSQVFAQSRGELFAWVIMPEHFHLLIRPRRPDETITRLLAALKRPFSRRVLNRWRKLDARILQRIVDSHGREHFWQRGGGYDRNIFSEEELLEKITYIHNNPVRRGLVDRPTDWRWSSAAWYEGKRDLGPKLAPWPNRHPGPDTP